MLLVPAYYECPMLCTLVLNGVVSALRALPFDIGREFDVVTVSFDPAETSTLAAAKKANYLTQYRRPGADAGWHFLIGDETSIRAAAGVDRLPLHLDDAAKQYAHASGVVVAHPGRPGVALLLRGRVSAARPPARLVEASNERIGSAVDQLLLFCFHYDPATGRYSQVALNAVRLGGVLTLMALGTFLFVMLRRDRTQPAPGPEVASGSHTAC